MPIYVPCNRGGAWAKHPGLTVSLLLLGWLLLSLGACAGGGRDTEQEQLLYVYNWEDYFGPETLGNFQRETGIRVVLETFDSEEEMLAGLQSRPGRYDVAIASDAMVATLRELMLLEPLDLGAIPNIDNIEARFRGLPFDPEGRYSVPYLWGTTGLAINTAYVPRDRDSWGLLWEPSYAGHIAMLDEPQEVMGAALKLLGYSLNSTDPQILKTAGEKLLEQRSLLAVYRDPIAIIDGLARGNIWAAQLYSGDALSAIEENPSIAYIIPREGAALWVDNLVIPVGAPHKAAAHRFIDYILRPEVGGDIASYLNYASPNLAARAFIPQEVLEDPSIYPDAQTLARSEFYQPLTAEANRLLNRIWVDLTGPRAPTP